MDEEVLVWGVRGWGSFVDGLVGAKVGLWMRLMVSLCHIQMLNVASGYGFLGELTCFVYQFTMN